jgi:asparagine synthase (glutamine-hydrolysing)
MCGIFLSIGKPFANEALPLMHHRGPDARGLKQFDIVGHSIEFGHCRLAINDLNSRANQPISWDNGRFWLVFNGEIYNFQELRSELEKLGCHFTTTSDSEVLVAALAVWKEEALNRIEGMFAFAFLDCLNGELLLARDPFGIKPLFFTKTLQGLVFSSEIPPLLNYPGVKRLANSQKVYDYIIFGHTDRDRGTLFSDIQSFPLAHIGRINLHNPTPLNMELQEYWHPKVQGSLSFEEATLNIREIFLNNIKLHLRGDVPFGLTLSGGIDSTAILAGMRTVGGDDLELNSFSFIAPPSYFNEEAWIKIASDAFGAKSHTIAIDPSNIEKDIDALIQLQGEPFGSTSIYAQYKVMQLAHTHNIKILLDGQGADEIFAGYRPFLAARLAEFLRCGKIIEATKFLTHIAKLTDNSLHKTICQAFGEFLPESAKLPIRKLLGLSPEPIWLNPKWLQEHRNIQNFPARSSNSKDLLHSQLYDCLTSKVLPALLRYQDRNSMAFSIETRVPFLTKKLVEAAYACPSNYLISEKGMTKSIFRTAMQDLIPKAIINRQDKIGFTTPEAEWLTTLSPWIKNNLNNSDSLLPFFNRKDFMVYFKKFLAGTVPYDPKIWRINNLIRWANIYDVSFQ